MTLNKHKLLAIGTVAVLGSVPAHATDKELLDMLLYNGSIDQAQYNKLIKKEEISKKDVSDINSTGGIDIKLDKKGLQFETADKAFKMKLGGRLHADATFHNGDGRLSKEATDGTEIRRARIYLKGSMWNDFHYMSEFDFADNNVHVKDLFLTYKGLDWLEITAGHQKHAVSMEVQESSNDIMFVERSLVYSLTLPLFDRAIGLNFKSSGDNWSAQAGVYGDTMNANKDAGNDEGWGLGSRVTFAPINTKTHVMHLGVMGGMRAPSDNNELLDSSTGKNLKLYYESTHMSNFKLSEASIKSVDKAIIGGLDAAYMYGPFSLQGEYAHLWVERNDNQSTLDFDALYIQAGWTLTGESRTYKGSDGEFKRLKPAKNFTLSGDGGWGAVELAARYDQNDLNSDDIQGGAEKAVTVAVNWYLNENVRLMADYRRSFDVSGSPVTAPDIGDVEEVDIFTLRTQWAF